MKRIFLVSLAVCFVLVAVLFAPKYAKAPKPSPPADLSKTATLSFGGTHISVQLALTKTEHIRGLGGRDALANNEGMLFVFGASDYYGIWMKDMRFPLDVLWLESASGDAGCAEMRQRREDQCLTVIDVRGHVLPESFPEVFYPKEAASYVLEMKGGASRALGIGVGSVLTLSK